MAKTYVAGVVTAYGAAVEAGYTGTYEEFCEEQAKFAENAQQVAEDRQAVEAAAATFTEETVPGAQAAITAEGTAQVEAVGNEGETQRGLIQTAGEGAVASVQAEGTTQIGLVEAEGADQVTGITAAGNTQIAAVNSAGASIINALPNTIAANYSASETYAVGDYVLYNNALYQCTTAIETAEEWTAEHWSAAKVADEVSDLNRQISDVTGTTANLNDLSVGRYQSNANGVSPGGTTTFGLSDMLPCDENTMYTASMYADSNFGSLYVRYYDANKAYISGETVYGSANAKGNSFITPSGAAYLHCYWYYSNGISIDNDSRIQVEKGGVPTPYIKPVTGTDYVARTTDRSSLAFNEYRGYFNQDGTISAGSNDRNEHYTERFDLIETSNIAFELENSNAESMWACIATYDENGDFIERLQILPSSADTATHRCGLLNTLSANVRYVAFAYRKYTSVVLKLYADISVGSIWNKVNEHDETIEALSNKMQPWIGAAPFRFKPCYDHLFVNKTGNNVVIPHESVFHVRISRLLGFNMIEANCTATSDGVFVVNHFSSGKFGNYFHHIDGTTDISNTSVSSVTWDWIVQNVRYNSTIEKYRTRPSRLEEFLGECRQQNIIPFLQTPSTSVIAIADKIMGKDNYVLYGTSRASAPSSIIYSWQSKTTKQEIIDACNSWGKPFIYGMSNPSSFTDEQLKDIVKTLHEAGYWIGVSYVDYVWYKYSAFGFDVNGTQFQTNRMASGNICNIDSIFGFDDFTFTNATETNGVLSYSADGTLSPIFTAETLSLGGVDFQIVFDGEITVPAIGEMGQTTYTSDGEYPVFFTTPIINNSPAFTVSVKSGTVVYDVKFKASKF